MKQLTPKRKPLWTRVFLRQRIATRNSSGAITTTKSVGARGEKSRKFVHSYSHFYSQINQATAPISHISSMKSAAIAICSLLLAGSDAFVPTSSSAGVRRHRPSTSTPVPASSLVESSQFSSTTSMSSSISPDQDEASTMFAPTEESNLSWVDLPSNKAQNREGQELADAFELYAGRVAMVASLGLLAGEFLNHKSITDQVLCALHIVD